ncbi:hypothetical protein Esti_001416 [Eimeria stiedai]
MRPSPFDWGPLWEAFLWGAPPWSSWGPFTAGSLRFASSLRGAPPVGQRQVKKLLRHGSRSRSPLLLLPPYIPIHVRMPAAAAAAAAAASLFRCLGMPVPQELRVFFRLPYPSVLSLCQVRQSQQTKTLRWRDTAGRGFELVNKRNVLVDFHRAAHAAKRFGLRAIQVDPEPDWQQQEQQQQQQQQVVPVVALLGHINHGKTTLLDRLAGTLVAPYEAGGITQQLLGVTVRYNPNSSSSSSNNNNSSSSSNSGRLISFIDTPGHAAMETMRARAAAAADVAVVVIEAEREGQQQTAEVIRQADACGLPVVFVLNKVDRLLLPSSSSSNSNTSSSNDNSHDMSSETVLRRLQQIKALEGEEVAASPSVHAESTVATTPTAAAAARGTARRQLLLLRMQLRRECQRMHEAGEVSRDLSAEAMRAVPVSALFGYNTENLIRRLLEVTDPLQLPLRMPASLSTTPGAAKRYKHIARRSDCLVEAHFSPSAIGVILDIQQTRDRGLIYTVLLKAGALLPGNYFVAGSAYGRIASISRYTCEFRGAPYTPEALREDQGSLSKSFEAGSILQLSTQRGKEGEAAVDDLLLCLPQARAFRLAQHRQRLEGLTLQQIDGPLLQLPWEVDHPKEPGSRWRLQQQHQQQIRRPVSEGRRAIEEFGCPQEEDNLCTTSSSNNNSSSSRSSLFTDATRADFERPLRSLPASSGGFTAPLDELELLRRGAPGIANGGNQTVCKKIELEPIIVVPEEEGEQWGPTDPHHEEAEGEGGPPASSKPDGGAPSLARRRRFRAKLDEGPSLKEKEPAGGEEGVEEALCMHNKPWSSVESREEWAERVVRENEALMGRWRAKSKQRKEAYAEQQRLERAAAVEAEQQRRVALQEALLTEEEVRRQLAGEKEEQEEKQRKARQGKLIPAPPKDAPVVPVILRTRYVGSFDVMLDEFEKLEAEMRMRIPVVHGGIGPVIPRDVVHAEVERTYGYCPIYAFQVPVLPDAVKQAVVSKVIIKKFDVFTDLILDVRNRCENIRRLQDHNLYVRSLKKQPTKSGL